MSNPKQIVYQLAVEDIQTVAADYLEREITEAELDIIKTKIAEYIPWYDAIWNCIAFELKEFVQEEEI
ncbi:MAG TPA: hypothetical protein ENN97_09500 [Phycisphaerales bacterium]|nr:hypothetical protein [Phycisphaerales bacterium]